jgi:hypothetical protein
VRDSILNGTADPEIPNLKVVNFEVPNLGDFEINGVDMKAHFVLESLDLAIVTWQSNHDNQFRFQANMLQGRVIKGDFEWITTDKAKRNRVKPWGALNAILPVDFNGESKLVFFSVFEGFFELTRSIVQIYIANPTQSTFEIDSSGGDSYGRVFLADASPGFQFNLNMVLANLRIVMFVLAAIIAPRFQFNKSMMQTKQSTKNRPSNSTSQRLRSFALAIARSIIEVTMEPNAPTYSEMSFKGGFILRFFISLIVLMINVALIKVLTRSWYCSLVSPVADFEEREPQSELLQTTRCWTEGYVKRDQQVPSIYR